MAYTPINWQTGDTITAEKMNKMDNGWGVSSTQLFSETVTTVVGEGESNASAEFAYSQQITADTITVSFNGTDYHCNRIDGPMGFTYYGGYNFPSADWSEYPFYLESVPIMGGRNALHTETAGTYTVAVNTENTEVSDNFSGAVNQCVDTSTLPMLCVSGVTTETEMETAQQGGKLLYFKYSNNTYIITGVDSGDIWFMPSNSSIVPTFIDGVFDIGEA